jgi:hypothetical protein
MTSRSIESVNGVPLTKVATPLEIESDPLATGETAPVYSVHSPSLRTSVKEKHVGQE